MATPLTDDVRKYVRHISEVSSPKAEYVRHFEDGRYVFTTGSPPSHAFAEIEGSQRFLDREVEQTVESRRIRRSREPLTLKIRGNS